MTNQTTFTSRLAAAASALMISLLLISTTVSTPSAAQATTVYFEVVGDTRANTHEFGVGFAEAKAAGRGDGAIAMVGHAHATSPK